MKPDRKISKLAYTAEQGLTRELTFCFLVDDKPIQSYFKGYEKYIGALSSYFSNGWRDYEGIEENPGFYGHAKVVAVCYTGEDSSGHISCNVEKFSNDMVMFSRFSCQRADPDRIAFFFDKQNFEYVLNEIKERSNAYWADYKQSKKTIKH